jgi:hypothetical protein
MDRARRVIYEIMSKKTARQLDDEIATALARRPTYWRIQHMADPISAEWRSQIGLDDENLGTEEGTSACTSLPKLKEWASGGHANWIGDLAIVEFEGDLVGRGTDGEVIVRPTREIRRFAITGGRAASDRISTKIQKFTVPDV